MCSPFSTACDAIEDSKVLSSRPRDAVDRSLDNLSLSEACFIAIHPAIISRDWKISYFLTGRGRLRL
jgi:hypothetical protein